MSLPARSTLSERADRLARALTGIATRRAIRDYVILVALMQFVLLTVGWAVDLASHMPAVRRVAAAEDLPLYRVLLPYLSYRSADMLARMLPMATFFGVFAAEILRRGRLETVIFTTGGASPMRMLSGVVIFGLVLGVFQYKLERDWRPAAVEAQVKMEIGSYAHRFGSRWTRWHPWFVSGDTAIRGQVFRGESPAMRDVLIFVGVGASDLRQVYAADRMDPGPDPRQWVLRDARLWDIAAGADRNQPVGDVTLTLDLIPEQLIHFQIPGFYLRQDALQAIASMRGAPTTDEADVAIWRRYTIWLLPLLTGLLAANLTRRGYDGRRINIPRLIVLALVGYIAVISIKVLWAVGELGGLPAPVAVCSSLVGFALINLWLTWRKL